MRFDSGTTDVPTAATPVQISNTNDKVASIAVKGLVGNTGKVYFGVDDVSKTNGWELSPGESVTVSFGDGSVAFNKFYVDAATSGDDVTWIVTIR